MLRCDKMITDYEWKLFQTKKNIGGLKNFGESNTRVVLMKEESTFTPTVSFSQMEYLSKFFGTFLIILWCSIMLVLYVCIEYSEHKNRKVLHNKQNIFLNNKDKTEVTLL